MYCSFPSQTAKAQSRSHPHLQTAFKTPAKKGQHLEAGHWSRSTKWARLSRPPLVLRIRLRCHMRLTSNLWLWRRRNCTKSKKKRTRRPHMLSDYRSSSQARNQPRKGQLSLLWWTSATNWLTLHLHKKLTWSSLIKKLKKLAMFLLSFQACSRPRALQVLQKTRWLRSWEVAAARQQIKQ